MKVAIAGWHYDHRTVAENAAYFLKNGYDYFSSVGFRFVPVIQNKTEGKHLAEVLDEINANAGEKDARRLTVHYNLPDPAKTEDVEKFLASIDDIYDWEQQYGHLHILSFDVWYPGIFFMVKYIVEKFAGTKVHIAFEDYCLNGMDADNAALHKAHPFYELIDAGHMNIREYKNGGKNDYESFSRAYDKLDLPVIETHIHNNDGLKDWHRPILDPEMLGNEKGHFDLEMYLNLLKDRKLNDVILTVEIMPYLYGNPGVMGDAIALHDLRYVRALCKKLGI